MKAQLNLASLTVYRGGETSAKEGRSFLPDGEGFIGLRLDNLEGPWSADNYVVVDMLIDTDAMPSVDLRFYKKDAPGGDPAILNYQMIPTRRVKLTAKLDELRSWRFFLPTLPGTLKGHARCNPCNISEMGSLEILVHPGYAEKCKGLTIYDFYLSDTLPDMTVLGEPMVDELGQWIQKEWNTKTLDETEMIDNLKAEYQRALTDNQYPGDRSKYGGWLKKRFEARGFFYAIRDEKRWWLVDPDGCAFISNGICYGTRMGVHGFVDGMENLFSWLPEKSDPKWKDAWTTADQIAEFVKRNTAEAGRRRYLFNFARANMIRAFGPDKWWDAWVTINAARVKRWGFNTLGVGVNNYFDERVHDYLAKAQIPFVWTLKEFPLTKKCIFRDFPDVFSDEYAENSAVFAKNQLAPFAGNPWMIGYFVTNEPEWMFQLSTNLPERVFAHQEKLATKIALIDFLKTKYKTVAALNTAWNRDFSSFDALYTPFTGGNTFSKKAEEDFAHMRVLMLEKYNGVPAAALKKVDPNHLNLGMRLTHISADDLAGSGSLDLISFNRYRRSAAGELEIIQKELDKPTVIGEWHVGGGDKGLFSWGLLGSPTQDIRGKACSYYLENAVTNPCCVGLHYFEFNDQPLLGRFDGECMQHGMIDICNRAYEDFAVHMQRSGEKIYEIAAGILAPSDDASAEIRTPR
jgi:hypothetical protein